LPKSERKTRAPERNPKEGLELEMTSQKQMEQSQDSEQKKTSLDRRYGKIGISAVAAACQPKAERPNVAKPRHAHYESD
jgi:hypothetical protein